MTTLSWILARRDPGNGLDVHADQSVHATAMNDSPFRRTHLGARVPVPADVFRGIEAVRLSGLTNMLDRPVVAEIAEGMGFDHAARWVRENRDLYARAIFHGFDVTEDAD